MISVTAFGQVHRPLDLPETFQPIPGFSRYQIGDRGTVSGPAGVMASFDNGKGYRQIVLVDDGGKSCHVFVHRLILMAHVGPAPTDRHQAAHWNGVRADNRLENLRWATPHENAADRRRHAAERRAATPAPTIH